MPLQPRHEERGQGRLIDLAVRPHCRPRTASLRRWMRECGQVFAARNAAAALLSGWGPRASEPMDPEGFRLQHRVGRAASAGGTARLVGDGCDGGLDDRVVPLLGAAGDKAVQLRDLEPEGRVLGLCTVTAKRCVCACARACVLGVRSHARSDHADGTTDSLGSWAAGP